MKKPTERLGTKAGDGEGPQGVRWVESVSRGLVVRSIWLTNTNKNQPLHDNWTIDVIKPKKTTEEENTHTHTNI